MQLHEIHAMLYAGLPEGTIINICEMSDNDARLVSDNVAAVAVALGHTGEALAAAQEGDTWYVNAALTSRFQALLAEYGAGEHFVMGEQVTDPEGRDGVVVDIGDAGRFQDDRAQQICLDYDDETPLTWYWPSDIVSRDR